MRLENKMHKWLKFIFKCFPFWFLFLTIFNIFFNESTSFDIVTIISNSISSNNYFISAFKELTYQFNTIDLNGTVIRLIRLIFGVQATNTNHVFIYNLLYFIFSSFFWFIIIDLIDLVYSAFRFIIDVCRSWLDSFYEKNKGGYK